MTRTAKERFSEVVESIIGTAEAKGWTVKVASHDNKKWKYASVEVSRSTGGSVVQGMFDIDIANGVKVSLQPLSFFAVQGLKNLHESIMKDLGQLSWLKTLPKETREEAPAIAKVERLLKRFQKVAGQIQHRHDNRTTLIVSDEYDVQDLLHALLWIDFDDIRPEEYSPTYAGGASRIDFLLKKEKILIEVKMTNIKLKDKQVGEQLIVDIQRYKEHPDCQILICFVYDPGRFLKNPVGLASDISGKRGDLPVKVIIVP